MTPVAYLGSMTSRCPGRWRAARIESPIPNIMAVVAVFEIHAEMNAVTPPNARRMRAGRAPTQGSERTV